MSNMSLRISFSLFSFLSQPYILWFYLWHTSSVRGAVLAQSGSSGMRVPGYKSRGILAALPPWASYITSLVSVLLKNEDIIS